MKLYELTNDYQKVLALAEEGQDITDTLESISGAIEVKAEGITHIVKNLEADTEAIEKEIKRLAELKDRNKKAVENIKNYLFFNMQAIGRSEIKTPLFTAKIQKNPAAVIIDDETKVDAKFLTIIPQSYKVDKVAIKEALKNGVELSYARLEQGERLVLK
jgi:hypothetical protein